MGNNRKFNPDLHPIPAPSLVDEEQDRSETHFSPDFIRLVHFGFGVSPQWWDGHISGTSESVGEDAGFFSTEEQYTVHLLMNEEACARFGARFWPQVLDGAAVVFDVGRSEVCVQKGKLLVRHKDLPTAVSEPRRPFGAALNAPHKRFALDNQEKDWPAEDQVELGKWFANVLMRIISDYSGGFRAPRFEEYEDRLMALAEAKELRDGINGPERAAKAGVRPGI